jgi:2-dehydro-3-deoxygalactonokinase
MAMFISCDWGTSSFRIRLVDATSQRVLAEQKSNHGIAEVHTQWKQQAHDESERFSFYQSIVYDHLKGLQEQITPSLKDIPIIISGMASSNIGMVELPYKVLPFAVNGSDLEFKRMNATETFPHEVVVISGARTSHDVMRGEEMQLIGCDFPSSEERIYILPGTHSKHVTVKDQYVIDFKTYMTGEFFQLLSQQSILSKSVDKNDTWSSDSLKGFEEGVEQSRYDSLLHESFLVRTNHLFGQYSKEVNYHYLSGLLIGTELKSLVRGTVPVTLVANDVMLTHYSIALKKLGKHDFEMVNVDTALVKGHCKVYQLL